MPLSASQAISAINRSIDNAVAVDDKGNSIPHVCIVCDHLLKQEEDVRISLQMLKNHSKLLRADGHAAVSNRELIQSYQFRGKGQQPWMEGVLLSPRANFAVGTGRGSRSSFSCCLECKDSLKNRSMPLYAIANKHVFGDLPESLQALNDVETALLSPVKGHGYTFVYSGGLMKNLKGVLSYFKVEEESIADAVLQLEALGLNGHVVVLLTGKMTPDQKQSAIQRTEIRVDAVIAAVEWLSKNNKLWEHVDLQRIRDRLKDLEPNIVDESEHIDGSETSEGNNIERTHSFAAYFPDGSMRPVFGGHSTVEEFKDMVEKAKTKMADIKFHCELLRERVSDYKDDNFARLCMLQMPFGEGGMNEERHNGEGGITKSLDLLEWIRHLSKISMPTFHKPLFVLVLQSVFQRQMMLRTSSLKVRGEHTHQKIANELNIGDLENHAKARRQGHRSGTFVSQTFFNCVDAVTRSLPHSNGAAAKARNEVESLVHHFGFPSFFLTFSPDDEHSHLLQVYSGVTIDDGSSIHDLDDLELHKRAKERKQLRINVPGLTAYMFEVALDIVLREVIGINPDNLAPTEADAHFGRVKATLITVEEQGRKTLHAHILLWVDEVKDMVQEIQQTALDSNSRLCGPTLHLASEFDRVATTKLFGNSTCRSVFQHQCIRQSQHPERHIECPSDQQLRNLRHKAGGKETNFLFAHCRECGKCFNHEEMVTEFVKHELGMHNLSKFPENDTNRLKAMCVEHQKCGSTPLPKGVVNAAYNTHLSTHTSSCWKGANKYKTEKGHPRDSSCECRMRLPDRKRQRTHVNLVAQDTMWYSWTGKNKEKRPEKSVMSFDANLFEKSFKKYIKTLTRMGFKTFVANPNSHFILSTGEETKMHMVELLPKRCKHDQLQNISAPAISESKLTCNSNVQVLTIGPIVFYVTKYSTKSTQKDETDDHVRVTDTIKTMLSDVDSVRRHEDDKKEAQRRVLRASFAHNSQNVMGSSMASWLTRRGTRFLFSHKFVWCPLQDLNRLLVNGAVRFTLQKNGAFLENSAMHFLCRGVDLEHQCAFDFYSLNETVFLSKDNRQIASPYTVTDYFKHPSISKRNKKARQGAIKRDSPVLIRFRQWDFLDSAVLGGDMLDSATDITEATEHQSRLILILFLPHRCNQDLLIDNSHTLRLRKAVKNNELNSEALSLHGLTVFEFLQNVQDCRANCVRNERFQDELERMTSPYTALDTTNLLNEEDMEDDEVLLSAADLDSFLSDIENTSTPEHPDSQPHSIDLMHIRCHSKNRAGHEHVSNGGNIPTSQFSMDTFVKTSRASARASFEGDSMHAEATDTARKVYTKQHLVKTIAENKSTRHRHLPTFQEEEEVSLAEANGTARSIIDWAQKSRLDKKQRRSFEIMAATFVLTFFDEATFDSKHPLRMTEFIKEHKNLKKLCQRNDLSPSLIAFIHGPGGSGKTTVVDLTKLYCEEFCAHLKHPFIANETIVVTALTGVAATLLLGDTTDKAVYLNQDEIKNDQFAKWLDTRLLIVDEISFASPQKISKLDENLRVLLGKQSVRFGGMNVVFAGDLHQLKAVKQESIIDTKCQEFDEWVNCFIELEGMHRFQDDPEWGNILIRFRNGVPTLEDFASINERVVTTDTNLPDDIKYATSTNKERDAINTAVFERHCIESAAVNDGVATDALLVFSDNIVVKKRGGKHTQPLRNRSFFWQSCGESHVKVNGKRTSKRVDPVLKLFYNCEVMLTENECVREARANGTRALVQKVTLKPGEEPFMVRMGNILVPATFASCIETATFKHVNKDARPTEFSMESKEFHVKVMLPKSKLHMSSTKPKDRHIVEMELLQLPVVSNTATTCHKLQGSGVQHLFVSEWKNEASWIYVILSRVTTRNGLFLRNELPPNPALHEIPHMLQKKLRHFRKNCTRAELSDSEYAELSAPTVNS